MKENLRAWVIFFVRLFACNRVGLMLFRFGHKCNFNFNPSSLPHSPPSRPFNPLSASKATLSEECTHPAG